MTNISLDLDTREVAIFAKRYPDRMDNAIRGTLEDGSTLMLAGITRYPAPPADSTYRRTNTLFRSWSRKPIIRTSFGWQVIIGSNANMAPYNRLVQSRPTQAAIHRGRWVTAEDVIEAAAGPIQRFAQSRIRAAMDVL
jgi:hypothetical protein